MAAALQPRLASAVSERFLSAQHRALDALERLSAALADAATLAEAARAVAAFAQRGAAPLHAYCVALGELGAVGQTSDAELLALLLLPLRALRLLGARLEPALAALASDDRVCAHHSPRSACDGNGDECDCQRALRLSVHVSAALDALAHLRADLRVAAQESAVALRQRQQASVGAAAGDASESERQPATPPNTPASPLRRRRVVARRSLSRNSLASALSPSSPSPRSPTVRSPRSPSLRSPAVSPLMLSSPASSGKLTSPGKRKRTPSTPVQPTCLAAVLAASRCASPVVAAIAAADNEEQPQKIARGSPLKRSLRKIKKRVFSGRLQNRKRQNIKEADDDDSTGSVDFSDLVC